MEISFRDFVIQFPSMEKPLLRIPEKHLAPGTRLLIRGPSGTGKTSLLHIVAGLLDAYRGVVSIDNQVLATRSEAQRCKWRREQVGIVFQRLNLLGHLTALENVLLGVFDTKLTRADAHDCLVRMGLVQRIHARSYNLSLGEQQRVAVARVLAGTPNLILADEPTSSLDDFNADQVIQQLLQKVEADGIMIVCTHDARITQYFDEVWTIADGTIQ